MAHVDVKAQGGLPQEFIKRRTDSGDFPAVFEARTGVYPAVAFPPRQDGLRWAGGAQAYIGWKGCQVRPAVKNRNDGTGQRPWGAIILCPIRRHHSRSGELHPELDRDGGANLRILPGRGHWPPLDDLNAFERRAGR